MVNKTCYQGRLLSNLCPRCGKRPPMDNRSHCQICLDYRRNREHKKNQQQLREMDRQRDARSKQEVMSHYGAKCACCGEGNLAFLTIDHINGNGSQHRIKVIGIRSGGRKFYRWLKAQGYPSEFQVLCMNCNFAKGHYGICPHNKGLLTDEVKEEDLSWLES